MLTLYDYYRSSACYRVRIALNLKSLSYDIIPIHLLNHGGEQYFDAYHAVNPQNLVPTLKEGDKILTQSLAIIEYINDIHPEPALLPNDPYHKALVKSFALTIACDLHPLNNLRVLQYLMNELHISEDEKTNWYHHWMHKGLQALETKLIASGLSGKYSFGDTPSLADICLIPQLFNAQRFHCDTSHYYHLMKINEHCLSQDAFCLAQPVEAT